MAGDWIKMRKSLPDDPDVIAIACRVGLDPDHVVGKLHRFWSWADDHTTDGHARGVTGAWLDAHVRVAGFADALVQVGWLVASADGLTIPGFDVHMSKSAKTRALAQVRQQNHRTAVTPPSRSERDETVTREEKRREEDPEAPPRAGAHARHLSQTQSIGTEQAEAIVDGQRIQAARLLKRQHELQRDVWPECQQRPIGESDLLDVTRLLEQGYTEAELFRALESIAADAQAEPERYGEFLWNAWAKGVIKKGLARANARSAAPSRASPRGAARGRDPNNLSAADLLEMARELEERDHEAS